MTPKEKAKKLFDAIYNTEHCGVEHFPNKKYCNCSEINLFQAKQCALIAVDNLLEEIDTLFMADRVAYWQKVKEEIKKL